MTTARCRPKPARAHRYEAEECVEIEAGERTRVSTDAEVALPQQRLPEDRQRERNRGGQRSQRRAWRIDPCDCRGRQEQLEQRSRELRAEIGQEPDLVDAVAALRHVGGRPALEVAVAEPRNFLEEGDPQPRLQPSSESERGRRDGEFEQQRGAGLAATAHPIE